MKSRYAVAKKLRAPSSKPPLARVSFQRPSPSRFANTPLPDPTLFGEPAVFSVLRPTKGDLRRNQHIPAQFLLFSNPELAADTARSTARSATAEPAAPGSNTAFAVRMLNYAQIVTAPTADTPGASVVLHFDNQRYLFGHVAEGTQRACNQRKLALSKLAHVFLSGPVNWRNAGGLLGLILTIAESHSSSKEQNELNMTEKAMKRKLSRPSAITRYDLAAVTSLHVHSGENLSHLIATSRRFIFRKGFPLRPHEVRSDPRGAQGPASSEPDWKDDNINVWYMPVESQTKDSAVTSPRKRSHDEFSESAAAIAADGDDRRVAETIVQQMFDSDWTMDALVQTTLHQAKLPAKLFVRDDEGHLQVYTGPMPGSAGPVPDIPVLVRQPWPGALVTELPRTQPSNKSMCYIVKGHDRRGRFNPEVAERLGVSKRDYRLLTNRQNAQGKDGIVVTPEMVLGETVTGSGFAMMDVPDISYIDALIGRPEWADSQIMKGVHVIFWLLGRDVVNDARLQGFMEKMSSVRHIVTSPDTCPNMLALESVATQAYKLHCIDPDRFPLPAYSNELALSGAPTGSQSTSTYEVGRVGKTVQFAPQYLHQDDKIIPFPDIPKLARQGLDGETLRLAAKAKAKVTAPDFIAKVEKVEADIPNRDTEIISLGTGSAVPSKYRNVAGTLVRVPGYGNYLFDAGENTMGQLRRVFGSELPSVLRDLKVIWISHLHADHHLGTASVIKAWHEETSKSDPSAQLFVSSHGNMIDWLREYSDVEDFGFGRLLTHSFTRFDPQTRVCDPRFFSSEETERFGLEKISGCWVHHCFGALATVFTFPSGLKIAYSGDCRPSEVFAKIGQGATLLIHESTFDDALKGDAAAKKHSTMSEAIDVGRRMGARRILLTHFSQRYQNIPIVQEDFDVQPNTGKLAGGKADEVVLLAFDYMRVKLGDFRKAQAFLPAVQKLFEGETSE